ncbi:MAG: cation-translocating P-type ATPase [Ferroplasma sp.]
MAVDPVCGMYVSEDTELYSDKDGKRYYFCSKGCKDKFDQPEKQTASFRIKLAVAWSFSIPVLLINYLLIFPLKDFTMFILVLPVQFYSGMEFYSGAYEAIKNRMGNMDLLITLGTLTAFIFSTIITFNSSLFPVKYTYFDASAFIITLILTGSYIESMTKKKANSAANGLLSLLPETVHISHDGIIEDIPADKMVPGSIILVRPGETIPADGDVIGGSSEVDESMITGESLPVTKIIGDHAISGTKNIDGNLYIKVMGAGKDSTVSKIYSMIQMASMGRAKIQRLSDIFSSYFVPVVLAAAASSSLFWYFYLRSVNNPLYAIIAILVFVSVVVVACPCAIGLAAPITLLISSNESSRNGILIKNSSSLDRLSKINMVIFDKTGTLTSGEPEIHEKSLTGNKKFANSLLYSMEINSNHPVARAIIKYLYGKEYDTFKIDNFKEIPGYGVTGLYDGKSVEVRRNLSHISLFFGNEELESLDIIYGIRENTANDIKNLNAHGIMAIIVTGDTEENTINIAKELGIKDYYCNIKPEGKANIVKKEQADGKFVMFVGDGINDTVAMETADVGVAMSSGSDIARESGDIILLNNDLRNVLNMIIIGKYTISKIKQNIGWAIGYNSALIPIAAGVLVPLLGLGIYYVLPIFAALAMGFSSTTVVLNSLRMRGHIHRSMVV